MVWIDEGWIVASMEEGTIMKSDMNGRRFDGSVFGGMTDSVNGWELHDDMKHELCCLLW